MKIKHTFQSQKADGADASLVRPSDWNAEHSLDGVSAPRQTALSGRVDASGYANFIEAGTGLSVNLRASSAPLRVAFASGFDGSGAVDFVGSVASDILPAWSGLPGGMTLYLYIDRDPSTGGLSYGFSTLLPAYQLGAPASPSGGQHWFDLAEMKMKRWDTNSWEEYQRVFLGECATDSDSVVSATAYALRGRYTSPEQTVPPNNNLITVNHNIGLVPRACATRMKCLTPENGYSSGDVVYSVFARYSAADSYPVMSQFADPKAMGINTVGGFYCGNKNTGGSAGMAASKWKVIFEAWRGW